MAKVLYERHGRIARITLNRPAVLNAIDDDLPRELAAAVERADADDAVHVIVLAGAGRAFCAGYDLTFAVPKAVAHRQLSSRGLSRDPPSRPFLTSRFRPHNQAAHGGHRALDPGHKARDDKPATVDAGAQGR